MSCAEYRSQFSAGPFSRTLSGTLAAWCSFPLVACRHFRYNHPCGCPLSGRRAIPVDATLTLYEGCARAIEDAAEEAVVHAEQTDLASLRRTQHALLDAVALL